MNEKKSPRNIEIDIRGQICPSSLLTTLKELNNLQQEIKTGKVIITVKTDNRDATATIPETATNMGYEASTTKENDYYILTIQKPHKVSP